MTDLVCLPATEPDDETYGRPPLRLEDLGGALVHEVRFPRLVWYNEAVRAEARAQLEALPFARCVLAGFSKSGLGAWHLARALPDRVEATLIFDAPMVLETIPRQWGAGPFYDDEAIWLQDLPIRGIDAWRRAVAADHRLVLISGASFHADMTRMSAALRAAGVEHTFLPRPDLPHRWDAGWLELGMAALQNPAGA